MPFGLTRKKIIILSVIIGVIFIGLLFLTFRSTLTLWLNQTTGDTSSKLQTKPVAGTLNEAQAKEVAEASTAANEIYNSNGNVDAAVAAYDSYAKSSKDGVVVATILFSKGLLLLNSDRFDEALEVGTSLEASAPTHHTAMLIAEAAAQLGDKAKAIEYYKLAIERLKPNIVAPPSDANAEAEAAKKAGNDPITAPTDNTLSGYEQRLAELEG